MHLFGPILFARAISGSCQDSGRFVSVPMTWVGGWRTFPWPRGVWSARRRRRGQTLRVRGRPVSGLFSAFPGSSPREPRVKGDRCGLPGASGPSVGGTNRPNGEGPTRCRGLRPPLIWGLSPFRASAAGSSVRIFSPPLICTNFVAKVRGLVWLGRQAGGIAFSE